MSFTLLNELSTVGGVFFMLTAMHYFFDWVFQNHEEAMAKSHFGSIRMKHCAIYSAPFMLSMPLVGLTFIEAYLVFLWVFITHYLEDTYVPVYWWAKYIRKPPQMREKNNEEGFLEFCETPLGKILAIQIDQIFHLASLFPVACYVVFRQP